LDPRSALVGHGAGQATHPPFQLYSPTFNHFHYLLKTLAKVTLRGTFLKVSALQKPRFKQKRTLIPEFKCAYSFIGHGKLGRALKPFILLVGVVARCIRVSLEKPASHPNDAHVPIGYYISGIK